MTWKAENATAIQNRMRPDRPAPKEFRQAVLGILELGLAGHFRMVIRGIHGSPATAVAVADRPPQGMAVPSGGVSERRGLLDDALLLQVTLGARVERDWHAFHGIFELDRFGSRMRSLE